MKSSDLVVYFLNQFIAWTDFKNVFQNRLITSKGNRIIDWLGPQDDFLHCSWLLPLLIKVPFPCNLICSRKDRDSEKIYRACDPC